MSPRAHPRPSPSAPPTLFVLAALMATGGCEIPPFEGAQIQHPPTPFFRQPDTQAHERIFPDLPVLHHDAWVHTDLGGVSTIQIHGHPGALTEDDVVGAMERWIARGADPDTRFGNIETLTIDGRRAWGWAERIESPRRGLVEVAYRAVVPYDTITYAIEFASDQPNWKPAAPDTLRAVVSTFAVGRVRWNVPLLVSGAAGALLMVAILRKRARERAVRLQSINLVKFKAPKGEKDTPPARDPDPGTPPTPGTPGARRAPPPPPAVPPKRSSE